MSSPQSEQTNESKCTMLMEELQEALNVYKEKVKRAKKGLGSDYDEMPIVLVTWVHHLGLCSQAKEFVERFVDCPDPERVIRKGMELCSSCGFGNASGNMMAITTEINNSRYRLVLEMESCIEEIIHACEKEGIYLNAAYASDEEFLKKDAKVVDLTEL